MRGETAVELGLRRIGGQRHRIALGEAVPQRLDQG
jgi:hypothetical protein